VLSRKDQWRKFIASLSLIGLASSCSSTPKLNFAHPHLPFRTVASGPDDFAGGTAANFRLHKRELRVENPLYTTIFSPHNDMPIGSEIVFNFQYFEGLKCKIGTKDLGISAKNPVYTLKLTGAANSMVACATENLIAGEETEDQLKLDIHIKRQSVVWNEVDKEEIEVKKNEAEGGEEEKIKVLKLKVEHEEIAQTLENLEKGELFEGDFTLLDKVYFTDTILTDIRGAWTYYNSTYRDSAGKVAKKEKNTKKRDLALSMSKWTLINDRSGNSNRLILRPNQSLRIQGVDGRKENIVVLRKKMGKAFPEGNDDLSDTKSIKKLKEDLLKAEENYKNATPAKANSLLSKVNKAKESVAKLEKKFAFPDEKFHSLVCAEDIQNGAQVNVVFRGETRGVATMSAKETPRYFFCQVNDYAYQNYSSQNHYTLNRGQFALMYQIVDHEKAISHLNGILSQKEEYKDVLEKQLNLRLSSALRSSVSYHVAENATATLERMEAFRSALKLSLKFSESKIKELETNMIEFQAGAAAQEEEISRLKEELTTAQSDFEALEQGSIGRDEVSESRLQKVRSLEKSVFSLEKEIARLKEKNKREGEIVPSSQILAENNFPEIKKTRAAIVAYEYEMYSVYQHINTDKNGMVTYSKNVAFSKAAPVYAYSLNDFKTDDDIIFRSGDKTITRIDLEKKGFMSLPTKVLGPISQAQFTALRTNQAGLKADQKNMIVCFDIFKDANEVNRIMNDSRANKYETYETAVSKISSFALNDPAPCFKNTRERYPDNYFQKFNVHQADFKRTSFRFEFGLSLKNRSFNGNKISTLFVEGNDVSACYESNPSWGGQISQCQSLKALEEYHPFFSFRIHSNLRAKAAFNSKKITIDQASFIPVWLQNGQKVWPSVLDENTVIQGRFEEIPGLNKEMY
jgi:hypothetical protein